MPDSELRRAEREWNREGGGESETEFLRRLRRSGRLTDSRLKLAARLGHQASQQLLFGRTFSDPRADLERLEKTRQARETAVENFDFPAAARSREQEAAMVRIEESAPAPPRPWANGLWGLAVWCTRVAAGEVPEARLRMGIALATRWGRERPADEARVALVLVAAESKAAVGTQPDVTALDAAIGREPDSAKLLDRPGRIAHCLLDLLRSETEPDHLAALENLCSALVSGRPASATPTQAQYLAAIQEELVQWALGHEDPVLRRLGHVDGG